MSIRLSDIDKKLKTLEKELQDCVMLARILACVGVWQKFEALRNMDAPFARKTMDQFIDNATIWTKRYHMTSKSRKAEKANPGSDVENYTGNLYAQCWIHYDEKQFVDTVNMFERRFRHNGIDPGIVKEKECLDAGCGGGRYTIAMSNLGAKHAVGVDISKDAIEDAKRRRQANGFLDKDVEFRVCSLLKLPGEWTGRFDFINCNGVLHHTTNPKAGLKELFRVLKPGGEAFIFVYGSGGLHWLLVDWVRGVLKDVAEADVRSILHLLGLPPGRIFHIMDHWFVPNYETLTAKEFESRLSSTGFEGIHKLPRGLFLYDSSERNFVYPEDRDLFGEGELRYIVRKP